MNFKEQLNAYIDVVGCSAADLAHAADISPSTISRYRSGRQLPKQPAIELNGLPQLSLLLQPKMNWDVL